MQRAVSLDRRLQALRGVAIPEIISGEGDPQGQYSNVFRVGFNAYEFVIDFGQQHQPSPPRIHTRIVTSPAVARNLRDVLDESMREYDRQNQPDQER